MAQLQEQSLFRLEIDTSDEINENDIEFVESEGSDELSAIEFEVLPPIDLNDKRRMEIYNNIAEIDDRLETINQRVSELNTEIDRLTNHADGIDYTIAVASGILTGLIDSFFIGEWNFKWDFESAKKWSNETVENFVVKTAKNQKIKDEIKKAKQKAERKGRKNCPMKL